MGGVKGWEIVIRIYGMIKVTFNSKPLLHECVCGFSWLYGHMLWVPEAKSQVSIPINLN